jgi:hypothetical protein
MSEPKHESSRNLLAEIEGDWDTPKSGATKTADPTAEELLAELDAAADRLVDSLEPPPISVRNVEELDSGWGDEEEDDEEEDDEANEPALPDEQLDPVAYAEAKQARDERIEARRERRRVKVEAKKARRKARADAQKSKQKGKQRKARAPQKTARATPREDDEKNESSDDEAAPSRTPAPRLRAKVQASSSASRPMLSKTNQWMLGFAVLVFIAAAVFAAVVAR